MARRKLKAGTTGVTTPIFVQDTSSSTGSGLSLAYNASGLVGEYRRQGDASWTSVTLSSGTLGTWSSGGWAADGVLTGAYEVGIPNAALASGARWAVVRYRGATNMLPVQIEFELDAVDYQDTAAFGLSRLDEAISTRSTYAGGAVASVTGNVGGSVASVTGDVAGKVLGGGSGSIAGTGARVDVATVAGEAATLDSGSLDVNVTQVGGANIPTPTAAGYLPVDVEKVLGADPTVDSGDLDVNVVAWKGATPNDLVSGKVDANATASLGSNAPANWLDANALAADAVAEIQAGLSTLNATGVRSAVGLASASLDAQLATIAGYIDTEVAAIKAKTDNLPTSPAAVGSAMTLQDGAITSAKVAVGAYTGVASGWIERLDQVWRRLFRRATRSATQILTYRDDGTTVQTTQAISDDGSSNESQGAAS